MDIRQVARVTVVQRLGFYAVEFLDEDEQIIDGIMPFVSEQQAKEKALSCIMLIEDGFNPLNPD